MTPALMHPCRAQARRVQPERGAGIEQHGVAHGLAGLLLFDGRVRPSAAWIAAGLRRLLQRQAARWACWQSPSITATVTGPLRLALRMAAKSAKTSGFTPSTLIIIIISDDGVFNRDVIDLTMMKPSLALLRQALLKAHGAYGDAIRRDLDKALLRLQTRQGWLDRCMQAMAMAEPKAVVWQRLRALRRN